MINELSCLIEQYSNNGDNTLECIGLTMNNDDIQSKIYRINVPGINKMENIPLAVREHINRTCSMLAGLNFFDYSERKTNKGLLYSVSYRVLNNVLSLEDKELKAESRIIKELFQIEGSPLIQIGWLIDSYGTEFEKKKYYTLLRSQRIKDNVLICKQCDFLVNLFPSTHSDLVMKYMLISEECNYKPFLLGINQNIRGSENKLYFILKRTSEQELVKTYSRKLLLKIGCGDRLKDYLQLFDNCNMYLRGFAISFEEKMIVWRFYYFPYKG